MTRFPLNGSFQGVNRLFVLAFNNTTENVAGNPINDTANSVRKITTGQRDDYKTGCLLDYQYFKDH